jgi:DNA polymerase-3 subunit delta
MITVLTGDNGFGIDHTLRLIVGDFNGIPEKIDGTELELKHLPDLLMGMTLFAQKRLIIIKDLSTNKNLWSDLANWLVRVSEDVHLVLIEPKLDKRTKTYKELQKVSKIVESKLFTDRDTNQVEKWAIDESLIIGFTLDKKSAQALVTQVGIDQWLLYHALEKLAVVDVITPAIINELIEANPTESVFNLFDAAMKKDPETVSHMIRILSVKEDPYRLFGLMSGQAFQLLALFTSDKRESEVAKDLGVHPYALSKLSPYSRSLEQGKMKRVMDAFLEADEGLKTSSNEPWLLLERALMKISNI